MDECSPVHAPSCREIGSVARLAGIAQSLSNAVEGGREPGADRPWRGVAVTLALQQRHLEQRDRKSTRLNSSHGYISYAVFCLKKKTKNSPPPKGRPRCRPKWIPPRPRAHQCRRAT